MGNHFDPKDDNDSNSLAKSIEPKPAPILTRRPVQRFEDSKGGLFSDALSAIRSDITSLAAEVSSRSSQNDSGLDHAVKRLTTLLEEYRLARIDQTRMHPSRFGELSFHPLPK